MSLDWVKGSPSPRLRTIQLNHDATFRIKDVNGNAVAIWKAKAPDSSDDRLQTRAHSADGVLSQTKAVSKPDGAQDLQELHVDAAGNAVIAWIDDFNRLQARRRLADGTLGPIGFLSVKSPYSHALAGNASGQAVVVWAQKDGVLLSVGP